MVNTISESGTKDHEFIKEDQGSQESLVLFDKREKSPMNFNADLGKQQSQVVLSNILKDSHNKLRG